MKRFLWVLVFIYPLSYFYCQHAYTQHTSTGVTHNEAKPSLDTSVLASWPMVTSAAITNNGKFSYHAIFGGFDKGTLEYEKATSTFSIFRGTKSTLIFKGLTSSWQFECPGVYSAKFTEDSKRAIFINAQDSLCILTLGTSEIESIPSISSFELFKTAGREKILFQLKSPAQKMVIRELSTGNVQAYEGVVEYVLAASGNAIVLKSASAADAGAKQFLNWVDVKTGNCTRIWEGNSASNLALDEAGTQLAFIAEDKTSNSSGKSCWYYQAGTQHAELLADQGTKGINPGLQLAGMQRFSKDGGRIIVTLQEPPQPVASAESVKVDVWSYQDTKLQSKQLLSPSSNSYTAILDILNRRILQLQQKNEAISILGNDRYALIQKATDSKEEYWNSAAEHQFYVISTYTGEKVQLPLMSPVRLLSPRERYIIGNETDSVFYAKTNNLISYNLETGESHNITSSITVPIDDQEVFGFSILKHRNLQFAGWLTNANEALVYDQYDIWRVDLSGKRTAVNITNGFGRKHKIVFRIISINYNQYFDFERSLIIRGFDETTKKSGYYRLTPNNKSDPEQLVVMSPVKYGDYPIKARGEEIYLVTRQNATESPNYYWTRDFKTFHVLSDIYPEKNFNWVRSELITWKTFDSIESQGVLYKPENFDPNKKYPIIFDYYKKRSHELNEYPHPEIMTDRIDIAWFVSRGYLVFTPDIHYTEGHVAQSVYNCVVSAAEYLVRFPWVDASHMGIQGHSFGGYETNCLVTQTKMFAAAMSASGFSNVCALGGRLWPDGTNAQTYVEMDQTMLGCRPWENPEVYIQNSPIFSADKVQTPLLILNNKRDFNFEDGIAFFVALRSLGKKVWMLQYDEGDHTLFPGTKDALDYHIRMTQFFDHYLKGAPAPKWMTRGIPASMKGIDSGLEFDEEINTPGAGLLKKENASYLHIQKSSSSKGGKTN